MIIPLENIFITVQRINVTLMFPFPFNFGFGEVHSAGKKHISADTDVAGIARCLITKTRNSVAVCV